MTRKPFTWQEMIIVIALLVQISGILLILAFKTIAPQNTALFSSIATGGVVTTLLIWANYRFGSSGSAEGKDQQLSVIMGHLVEMAKVPSGVPPLPPTTPPATPPPTERVVYVQVPTAPPAPPAPPAPDYTVSHNFELKAEPAPPLPSEDHPGTPISELHKNPPPTAGGQ